MQDSISIGCAPCDEDCAQVGEDNYLANAKIECQRFIDLIRKIHGSEPLGARLRIKRNQHDMGSYLDVECVYSDQVSEDYAIKVENNLPARWE
jgi:hypothetical protein